MDTYCIKYEKIVLKPKIQVSEKLMLLLNCAVCGKKKSTFIEKRELHNFSV